MSVPIEYFGTAASVIVAVSLTQKNIKKLRILSLIGSVAFAVYGFLITAWPVFGLNALIALINIYYLIEMKRMKNYFELLIIERPSESVYLRKFIEFYKDDIISFIPDFQPEIQDDYEAVFVLRDILPVSMVIYRKDGRNIDIIADYAVPAYRDMQNARYFFDRIADTFKEKNPVFTANQGSRLHNRYLQKIGFRFMNKERKYIYEQ